MTSEEKIGLEIAQFLGWDQSSHGEMVMRGHSLKTGLLSLAALFSAGAAQAEPMAETLRFAVMRDGQQIGSNTIELRRNGPETTVQMVTHVQVTIAFVTVYRFDQTETERWVGGKLMALSAVTNDNGTMHRVKATRAARLVSSSPATNPPIPIYPNQRWLSSSRIAWRRCCARADWWT